MALREREAELGSIAAAVDAARRGHGSLVLVDGPAGIGKSALLAATSVPAGVRRLRARGGELERELPLGVARQLLEPALADTAIRARVLEGAGPAAAALEGRPGAADGDAAALLHGLHRIVCNLAAEGPLVVEVDDVQWADAASLRFLAFLARRLEDLAVALLLARRAGERSIDEPALSAIAGEPLTRRLALEPLSASAAEQVIATLSGTAAGGSFADACHAASAGNPFVLRELLLALRAAGVPFDDAGARRVGEVGAPAVSQWVLRRLERLPDGAGRLARAVAVLGPHADLGRAAHLAGLSLEDAGRMLDALVAADLLRAGRPLDFVHPVVRAAIHGAIPPGERSLTHRSAARLLHDQRSAPEAVAVHLLAVEPGGETWVAKALLAGAELALTRGAPEVAAAQVERALAEPAPPALRTSLLHTLGNAERRLGRPTADGHFLEAYEHTADLRERARILLDMVITGGPDTDVTPQMEATMRALAPTDPELALILRARMIVAMEPSGKPLTPHLVAAEAALAAHPEATFGARLMAATLAFHKAVSGAPRHEAVALGMQAIGDDAAYLADLDAGYPHIYGIGGLAIVDALELPTRRLELVIARALERGSLIEPVIGLFYRAHVRLRKGELLPALDDARSALDHATRTSEAWPIAMSVGVLAETLVELGRIDEAQSALDDHREIEERLPPPPLAQFALARSTVAGASGRFEEALALARIAGAAGDAIAAVNPTILPWRARAGLALVALGRADEARAIAEEALRIAEAAELPGAAGEARRVLAATTGDIGLLRQAVADLEQAPAPLELARALLDLGAALRRSGHRRDAREPLARALELAHRHGAAQLALAARTELHAAGARPRREMRSGLDSLTPSERRVADLAAAGLSNAEIAHRLFITRKTTEHHLAATYRKLGISSRGELTGLLDR